VPETCSALRWFLPTPPRGRRLPSHVPRRDERPVSTHASAREATGQTLEIVQTNSVSTHASAREATCHRAHLPLR